MGGCALLFLSLPPGQGGAQSRRCYTCQLTNMKTPLDEVRDTPSRLNTDNVGLEKRWHDVKLDCV